jgi:ankyrin repeat protein
VTPLHYAALSGQSSTVQLLLDHGAEITSKDDQESML